MTLDDLPSAGISVTETAPSINDGTQDQLWVEQQSAVSMRIEDMTPSAEVDFDLIWPDSEVLFQTIMSSDTANQWQMPLGTLPFPPSMHQSSNGTFGTTDSFHDRGSSIGAIPSGGSHRAVHDVSKMVTSLVSFLIIF